MDIVYELPYFSARWRARSPPRTFALDSDSVPTQNIFHYCIYHLRMNALGIILSTILL